MIALVSGSFRVTGDRSATHKGAVETSTTELTTVVYCSEEIQVAKWSARNIPEPIANHRSLPCILTISARYLIRAIGARNNVAKHRREAAITIDGAYT
jgi:hypothetical protein